MSVQCIAQAFAYDAPSPTTKLVLLALANYADENAQCFPPVKRIVAETGLSERAVRNAIKALIDAGAVVKEQRRRKDGTQTSDLFTLFPKPSSQTARRAGSQTAPDAACEPNRLHDVPVQTAPGAPLTTFEPSLEPSLAAVVTREPANDVAPVVIVPTVDDWPEGDTRHHAQLLASAADTVRLDPARQPGLTTTLGRLAAWRRDGASWEHDVVPVVTTVACKRGPPIGSWKFFDSAIAQSIADNAAALTIPEARHAAAPHEPSADHRHAARLDNYASHWAGAEQAADVMAARRSL